MTPLGQVPFTITIIHRRIPTPPTHDLSLHPITSQAGVVLPISEPVIFDQLEVIASATRLAWKSSGCVRAGTTTFGGAEDGGCYGCEVGADHGEVGIDDAEAGLECCPEEAHWKGVSGIGKRYDLQGFDADDAYDGNAFKESAFWILSRLRSKRTRGLTKVPERT